MQLQRPLLTWLTDNDGTRRPISPALARHVDTLGRGTADRIGVRRAE